MLPTTAKLSYFILYDHPHNQHNPTHFAWLSFLTRLLQIKLLLEYFTEGQARVYWNKVLSLVPNIHGCKLFIVINLMEFTTKHHYGFCWLWNVGNYLWDIRVSIFCFKKCPLHLVVTSCPTLTCTRSKGERINVGSSWLPYFDILNVICALLKRWKIKRRLLLVVHSLSFDLHFCMKSEASKFGRRRNLWCLVIEFSCGLPQVEFFTSLLQIFHSFCPQIINHCFPLDHIDTNNPFGYFYFWIYIGKHPKVPI